MVSEHASPLATLGGADAGGQNVHVAALAAAMGRRDMDVVVHTRRDDPGLPDEVALAPGVTVHHVTAGPPLPAPKDTLLPWMDAFGDVLAEHWTRRRPDVVHTHFWMSAVAALRARRAMPDPPPIVHTFHALGVVKRRYQGEKDTSPPERLALEREIIESVDAIVCTCTDEAFELLRLGARRGQLTVVPCGVDLGLFASHGPREATVRPRLLSVGRLVERKGVGNAIRALADLPEPELVVAGGPDPAALDADPEVQRLRSVAEAEGVADRVHVRGRVERPQLPALMRSATAVICVPWYEPFGIVPLEAMASGVPVVAAAVGGLIDTVVDGVTGVHVAPRDPDRLAETLRELLGDPARRQAYGRAGEKRARSLYDWERVAGATADVYQGLVRTARRSRPATAPEVPRAARRHVERLRDGLDGLTAHLGHIERWGEWLASALQGGGRLLVTGNGGSAAEAQHLAAELVGRFGRERAPLSALCLHADTSTLTALTADFGADEAFARQVRAQARPGDVLLVLSASGRSPNVLAAARAAREMDVQTWALTGAAPNPLEAACDDAISLDADSATAQELHLVAIHLLCDAVERRDAVPTSEPAPDASVFLPALEAAP
jgi:type III pantothenate kinase